MTFIISGVDPLNLNKQKHPWASEHLQKSMEYYKENSMVVSIPVPNTGLVLLFRVLPLLTYRHKDINKQFMIFVYMHTLMLEYTLVIQDWENVTYHHENIPM